ncbi:uroporphyrin-III C-methyltransferase [Caldisphaera lagunensis DSM 15908]|uniref:uroporphyrinogen-III C-methyltransferase n=1 Tax=Caldisphaera lagunensis (strain DSM 15908 / JCM 11604 / ANMR 0165 / IC-154) TaxID=1056495 RepID=L0ACU3_CALLD|nr:uroporphyrinogen-III C-methyltransferase [Caldisphaera lagunensis]AFZ70875.1 uroporphyrin-III C-methyltransferase [Caldisphaera lagunensis DSM 15908]
MNGKVFIVGAGPGDPELITVKALNLIKNADVLIYDRLVSKKLLEYCKSDCELIYVGKSPGKHEMEQEKINEMLVNKAMEGKTVVRLKGGDPYIFGRGEEECSYVIEKGILCEVVPGIPSFIGAAVYAGIPLTNRNISSSFSVITGKEAEEKKISNVKLEEIAKASNTIVILMGISTIKENLETIARVKGYDEKCAIVMNATTDSQRVFVGTIKEILDNYENLHLENPAIIIIGKIVNMRDKLWKKS